ncbi:MAG: hypothetical protein M1838_002102 [Thelocarpon superellum]|nr:MAG: hypothetical protein M1838_002102 [Thelocarpon superellum]
MMNFVDGETLWAKWADKSAEQKLEIAKQLRAIMVAMRSLEPATAEIGSCGGGPALGLRVYDTYRGGLFPDEEAFNAWLTEGTFNATPPILVQEFRKRFHSDHRIVFSHGDFARQNIIVKDNRVVSLVDWQHAGWYPEHWEFIKFFVRSAKSKNWYQYAREIFPESYFDDLFLYQFLSR